MSEATRRILAEPPVRAVREALKRLGWDGWVVGGTVRDALLGRPLVDIDVVVAGNPERAARAVGQALGGPVFRLSEDFGAWRAIDGRRRFVCDVSRVNGAAIGADLAARDFTVNAMAAPLDGGDLLDPHGGREDLRTGVLRVVGEGAYAADPLRPLRLARLATELSLAPEPRTERLTRSAAGEVRRASGERVFAELRRIAVSERVVEGIELCDQLGLIEAVLPELSALHGVQQSHFHHLDVYDHTLEVLRQELGLETRLEEVFGDLAPGVRRVLDEPLADELTRGQALRLAALLHDVGKPPTRSVRPNGRVMFLGHDSVGEEMVGSVCRRLRTSERLRGFLGAITRHHLVLGFMVHDRPLSRRDTYRYLTTCRPVEVEVTLLSCADRLATRGRGADTAIGAHLEVARDLMRDALAWRTEGPPRLPLRGDELAREVGLEPGPELGRLLATLEEARFAGEVETRTEVLDYARRLRGAPTGDR